jgi:hypothetical protein
MAWLFWQRLLKERTGWPDRANFRPLGDC